jgi:hypothetical protein
MCGIFEMASVSLPPPSRFKSVKHTTAALTSLLILLVCFTHGLFPASRHLRHVVELKQMKNSEHCNCVMMWLTSTMTKAFHTVDVDLWLDSGTLIAYHRHPDRLIDGDYDIDVGMSVEDCHKVTSAAASHALQVQALKAPPPTTCLQHPHVGDIVFKPYVACNLTSGYVYAKVFYNWKNAQGEEKSVHGDIFRYGNLLAQKLTPYWNKRLASNKEMYQDWWVLVGNGNGHSNANPIPPSALYPLQKGVLGGVEVLVVRCLLFLFYLLVVLFVLVVLFLFLLVHLHWPVTDFCCRHAIVNTMLLPTATRHESRVGSMVRFSGTVAT